MTLSAIVGADTGQGDEAVVSLGFSRASEAPVGAKCPLAVPVVIERYLSNAPVGTPTSGRALRFHGDQLFDGVNLAIHEDDIG